MNNYVALGDLIKSISKTHKFDKDELVFLNTSDVLEGKILIEHYTPVSELKGQAKKTIKNGDILYSEIRPKNKRYAYVKNVNNTEDYVVSTKLMVLRNSSEKLNTDYLYHFLTFEGTINYLQKRAENRIGSFPQITFDIVKTIKIWLPELKVQKQIAKVLSDLDAKIEVNNKINQELEALAKSIYDYWFVQFDFPDQNGKPYKSFGGLMVYNEELKREIPEGWEVNLLGDLGNFKNGVNYDPSNPGEIACPIINVRNISASSYFLKNEDLDIIYLNESDVRKYSVHEDSIIIARSGIPGATRLIADFQKNTLYCGFAIHYQLENTAIKLPVFFYLKSIEQIIKEGSGGTILKNVNQATLNGLKIALPSSEILIESFNKKISPMFKKINLIQKENQKLAALRDWLLPMLMNGQVRVAHSDDKRNLGEAKEQLGMVAEEGESYKS